MKRLIILLLAACGLLAPVSSWAVKDSKTWSVALHSASGVSDPGFTVGNSVSGVSAVLSTVTPFELDGVAGATIFDLTRYNQPLLTFQLGGAMVLSAISPVYNNTNATYSIYWRESLSKTGLDHAELIPVLVGVTVTHKTTPYMIPFRTSQTNYGQLLFKSECTGFVGVTGWVQSAEAPPGVEIPLQVIAEGSFAMPAGGGTGVSEFVAGSIGAWPGGDYLEVLAGNSIYARCDGNPPSIVTGGYAGNTAHGFSGAAARNVQFRTLAAQTVHYRIYNRKP